MTNKRVTTTFPTANVNVLYTSHLGHFLLLFRNESKRAKQNLTTDLNSISSMKSLFMKMYKLHWFFSIVT